MKWDDDFRRNDLNREKAAFLKAWIDTGLKNPRIYVEGWMTETYALWNLDPLEHGVQSRFGWALSDENTKNMKPSDNDMLALGDFPIPFGLKAFLGNYTYSGSRFLGSGLCLWITLSSVSSSTLAAEEGSFWQPFLFWPIRPPFFFLRRRRRCSAIPSPMFWGCPCF